MENNKINNESLIIEEIVISNALAACAPGECSPVTWCNPDADY